MSPPIDAKVWASLLALEAAGEPGFLRELVAEFLAQAPKRMAALGDASQRADAAALEREAHGFKGSCGSLGARAMADCCERLETMGRDGSCAGAAEVLRALDREWLAARSALQDALERSSGSPASGRNAKRGE